MRIKLWLISALALTSTLSFGQSNCADLAEAKTASQGVDDFLSAFFKDDKAKQANLKKQIDDAGSDLVAKGKWSESQQASFFKNLINSNEFKEIESKKSTELYLFNLATSTMLFYRDKQNYSKACESVEDIKRQINKVGQLNEIQYQMMLSKINEIAKN